MRKVFNHSFSIISILVLVSCHKPLSFDELNKRINLHCSCIEQSSEINPPNCQIFLDSVKTEVNRILIKINELKEIGDENAQKYKHEFDSIGLDYFYRQDKAFKKIDAFNSND